jgi:hypothetical protein
MHGLPLASREPQRRKRQLPPGRRRPGVFSASLRSRLAPHRRPRGSPELVSCAFTPPGDTPEQVPFAFTSPGDTPIGPISLARTAQSPSPFAAQRFTGRWRPHHATSFFFFHAWGRREIRHPVDAHPLAGTCLAGRPGAYAAPILAPPVSASAVSSFADGPPPAALAPPDTLSGGRPRVATNSLFATPLSEPAGARPPSAAVLERPAPSDIHTARSRDRAAVTLTAPRQAATTPCRTASWPGPVRCCGRATRGRRQAVAASSWLRSMCPKRIGGNAVRAEVGRTGARYEREACVGLAGAIRLRAWF